MPLQTKGVVNLKETTIKDKLSPENVVHLHGLHRENAPYLVMWVLYYTWVVAFATWWKVSPVANSAFDTQIRSSIHIVNLLSSAAFAFIIQREWYVKALRIGSVLIVMSMISFYALPSVSLKMFAAVSGAVIMGCVNICILLSFVFTLNNTEKLYAVVSSNVLIQLVSLMNEHIPSGLVKSIISFALLIFSLSAVLFFRRELSLVENPDVTSYKLVMSPRVYLSLFFNCVIVILCKGVGKGILNIATVSAGSSIPTGYYIGGLAGCLVYVLVYAFIKKAYIWLGNLTFSGIAIGLLCDTFIPQAPGSAIPFAVFLGFGSAIGMINMYYIIGVIGKKYDSLHYIRMSILFIGICGGTVGIIMGNMISRIGTIEISNSASVFSVVVMLAFMFVSPVMERAEYVNDWGLDSGNTEVGGSRLSLFKTYGLSKREAEVCELLLQGYTLRQISAILPIAYSTVNTYCTSAYRKLGINSRTELLLKFKDLIIK